MFDDPKHLSIKKKLTENVNQFLQLTRNVVRVRLTFTQTYRVPLSDIGLFIWKQLIQRAKSLFAERNQGVKLAAADQ